MNNSLVMVEWQSTGPTADNRVTQFLCRRDRESIEEPCKNFVWKVVSDDTYAGSYI